MSDDLVKRLRALRVDGLKFSDTFNDTIGSAKIERCDYTPAVCMDAADRIEVLERENERLKRDRDEWKAAHNSAHVQRTLAEASLSEALAALKEAADYISKASDRFDGHDVEGFHAAEVAERKARATLARAQGNAEGDGNE
jgi:hypothetical protein